MAPPGAHIVTPMSPSTVGPRDVHVYGIPGSFSLKEYSATIISGETYAPTPVANRMNKADSFYTFILNKKLPMIVFVFMSGGVPIVHKAGP